MSQRALIASFTSPGLVNSCCFVVPSACLEKDKNREAFRLFQRAQQTLDQTGGIKTGVVEASVSYCALCEITQS